MKKTILIFGGSSNIGKKLIAHLIQQEYGVVSIVRTPSKQIINNILFNEFVADFSDFTNFENAIQGYNFEVALNFCWGGVSGKDKENYEIQINNVLLSCKIIDFCKKINVKKFMSISSISEREIYNDMYNNKKTTARNVYSSAKLAMHSINRILADQYDIQYSNIQLANTYGYINDENLFITRTLLCMLKKEIISLSACEQLYDFIHIEDVIEGISYLIDNFPQTKNCYLGSGHPDILKKYVELLAKITNYDTKINYGKSENEVSNLNYEDFVSFYNSKISFEDGIKSMLVSSNIEEKL